MITVENLSKSYGSFEAVRDISFSVGRDQVLGFLGPNGAGKTTIMKILTGFHLPSGGQVEIDGISLEEDHVEIKKRIGYLPESNPLYGDLSPVEYLNFVASARLLPKGERKNAIENAIKSCGLEEVRTRRIESLSKGYKQRVGLAQAIIHDPPILILDEPTSGLDPNQIIEIRSLIRELGKRKTVILSTHILQEVEAVCSNVLILNEGRIAAQGSPEEIAKKIKGVSLTDNWELHLLNVKPADAAAIAATDAAAIDAAAAASRFALPDREIEGLYVESVEDGIVKLKFNIRHIGNFSAAAGARMNGELIFDWAASQGYKIIEMTRKKLSLEDIFVKLTNEPQETAEEKHG